MKKKKNTDDNVRCQLNTLASMSSADKRLLKKMSKCTKNIYNISADITGASLSIFKNYVNLTNASIKGVFNGDKVLLNGAGKINNFNF